MKKERNCGCAGSGTPYPVYPAYPGMMPMNQGMGMNPMMMQGNPMMGQNMMNQGMPNNIMMPTSPSTNMNTDYSTLANQVNNLERRVSRLESMINSSNNMTPKYSESNYYMV